jgi:type II secretory pathway pseudopilin PulG
MTQTAPIRRPHPSSEEGYILIAVIFLLALLTISLSVAMPRIAKQLQRDRELETVQRGKQYVRAVKMYYKKFGSYPPNIDALVNTNQLHFLRKRYVDPTTGKEEWKIIHFGEAKTQSMGFFGQPLAGMGTFGGMMPGANGLGGDATGIGAAGIGGSGIGGAGIGGAGIGQPSTPLAGGTSDGGTGSTDTTASTDPNASAGTGLSGSAFGGQAFGGLGIIGFSPTSPKQSIRMWRKKDHYNQWEFVYDPLADGAGMNQLGTGPPGGLQGGAPGVPGGVNLGGNAGGASPVPDPAPSPAPAPDPTAPQP